jgi:hypothetical protein
LLIFFSFEIATAASTTTAIMTTTSTTAMLSECFRVSKIVKFLQTKKSNIKMFLKNQIIGSLVLRLCCLFLLPQMLN